MVGFDYVTQFHRISEHLERPSVECSDEKLQGTQRRSRDDAFCRADLCDFIAWDAGAPHPDVTSCSICRSSASVSNPRDLAAKQ